MTRLINATTTRRLFFSVFLIASSAIALPVLGDEKKVSNGCTMTQIRSPQGSICIDKAEKDLLNKQPVVHILVCKSSEMACCLADSHGTYTKCEVLGAITPPPEVGCANLKTEKGVWTPDAKSIKANPDKKSCSQVYTCNPPPASQLSESQNKCTAVVSVSNKQVTMTGTCVPGSSPGTCSSCQSNQPNEPCLVSFRK